jgi:hypothetical protein
MRTLFEIINKPVDGQDSQVSKGVDAAIRTAFWAGQEEMRGRIVRGLESRYKSYLFGRYHNIERKAMSIMMQDGLLGGEGRDDSSEFLSWDFDI